MTVPGMAKLSMVPNSNICLPANCWRVSSQAVMRPMAAVSGADTTAMVKVVARLLQAEPFQCRPKSLKAISNPLM